MKRLIQLLPVFLHRVTGWLPFQPKTTGKVQFANIGEGTYQLGVKSYLVDSTNYVSPGIHDLVYQASTNVPSGGNAGDYCTPAINATTVPLGASEDAPDSTYPIAIRLFGAAPGTMRVRTDGTITTNLQLVMVKAGTVTVQPENVATYGCCTAYAQSAGNYAIGRALITSDQSTEAGSTITIIPMTPIAGISALA